VRAVGITRRRRARTTGAAAPLAAALRATAARLAGRPRGAR
jgi:hypothetical protein